MFVISALHILVFGNEPSICWR